MTSQIPKVFTHCHPPLILHTHFAPRHHRPAPDPQFIPQKLCTLKLFRAPPSPCYELPCAGSTARQDLQGASAVPALQVHGRPDIVIHRNGCSVLGEEALRDCRVC